MNIDIKAYATRGRDIKKQAFCWQEKNVFRLLQKVFKGSQLVRHYTLYTVLTHMDSDFTGKQVKHYTKTIAKYCGLPLAFIPKGLKTLQTMGIIKIIQERERGKYKGKSIVFTPDSMINDAVYLSYILKNPGKPDDTRRRRDKQPESRETTADREQNKPAPDETDTPKTPGLFPDYQEQETRKEPEPAPKKEGPGKNGYLIDDENNNNLMGWQDCIAYYKKLYRDELNRDLLFDGIQGKALKKILNTCRTKSQLKYYVQAVSDYTDLKKQFKLAPATLQSSQLLNQFLPSAEELADYKQHLPVIDKIIDLYTQKTGKEIKNDVMEARIIIPLYKKHGEKLYRIADQVLHESWIRKKPLFITFVEAIGERA